MTGTLRGVSNKHCLLSFFFIASKFDYFVIHEKLVQSACRRHRQCVTMPTMLKCFYNIYS